MVQIRKSVDRLIHFIWKDRNSNKIEDDLIIFPGLCTEIQIISSPNVFLDAGTKRKEG